MAQLKSTVIQGSLGVIGNIHAASNLNLDGNLSTVNDISGRNISSSGIVTLGKLNAPTTSNGSTYGIGSDKQVLRTNGTTVYWGNESPMTDAGDIIYGGTNGASTRLPKGTGTTTEVLVSGNAPSWSSLIDLIYPAGSIYMSMTAAAVTESNPSGCPIAFLGGTWERISQGRMLIGEGTEPIENKTYAIGAEGGSATHTLTINEMPSHNHTGLTGKRNLTHHHNIGYEKTAGNFSTYTRLKWVTHFYTTGGSTDWAIWGEGDENKWEFVTSNQVSASYDLNHDHTISAEGDGQAHNNLPPYLTVYMWKRTA